MPFAPGRGGVIGKSADAPCHPGGQFAVAFAVEAERGVEDVDALRHRPRAGKGFVHRAIATVTAWIRAMRIG